MIQSYDHDGISMSYAMDCMCSAWDSLKLASKCQKPVVVTLLVWCLTAWGVLLAAWGVLLGDKEKS